MIDDRPDKLPCPKCGAEDGVQWCWSNYGRPVSDVAYKRGHWKSRCDKCGETVHVVQHDFKTFEVRK